MRGRGDRGRHLLAIDDEMMEIDNDEQLDEYEYDRALAEEEEDEYDLDDEEFDDEEFDDKEANTPENLDEESMATIKQSFNDMKDEFKLIDRNNRIMNDESLTIDKITFDKISVIVDGLLAKKLGPDSQAAADISE